MLEQIKKTMIISMAVLFLVSLTASAVSAGDPPAGWIHEDNGNGNDGQNNGQGNYGTPGYDNQQDGDNPGEHMGSEYLHPGPHR